MRGISQEAPVSAGVREYANPLDLATGEWPEHNANKQGMRVAAGLSDMDVGCIIKEAGGQGGCTNESGMVVATVVGVEGLAAVNTGDCVIKGQSSGGRDLVSETAGGDSNYSAACYQGRGGRTSGKYGTQHKGLLDRNKDWLRVISPEKSRYSGEDLCCTLWVADQHSRNSWTERYIDIFDDCLQGLCDCIYTIDDTIVQIKPCRVFAEGLCRGDVDPDWEYVLRGVCFGFRVIDDTCDSNYNRGNYGSITKGEVGVTMMGRIQAEIDAHMLTVVEHPCRCIHSLGAVPKGDDDYRAIVDCSSPEGDCVNEHTAGCRANFSYNSVESVTEIMQRGDYLATVDISNAYRAINTHPMSREKQGLAWDFGSGLVYLRDNRLCMGLSSSPYVFSKISDFVVRCMVREGYRLCINYLDDFCVVARTESDCLSAQWALVRILRRLGFYVSYKKLVSAGQKIRFLGIEMDSVKMELRLPVDKLMKLQELLKSFLNRRKASKKELESLAGVLSHCCKVVHGGRTFSRRVYDLVASVKKGGHKVRLNEEFRLDLKWWLEFAGSFNGKASIIQSSEPCISVYSDACLSGFGASHGVDWLAGAFDIKKARVLEGWLGHHYAGAKDTGCVTDNINVLELWPILVGIRKWCHGWENRTVVFVTDNTQVLAALNSGRSKNKTTMKWLRLIFWLSITYNFDVQSVYINTRDNIICDSLSRLDVFKNIARIRDADAANAMCCHHIFSC